LYPLWQSLSSNSHCAILALQLNSDSVEVLAARMLRAEMGKPVRCKSSPALSRNCKASGE